MGEVIYKSIYYNIYIYQYKYIYIRPPINLYCNPYIWIGGKKMKNITVSTTIPADKYEEIKAKKYAFNELLLAGLDAKKNHPAIMQRLESFEKANKDALARIARLQNKVWSLEYGMDEVNKVENRIN